MAKKLELPRDTVMGFPVPTGRSFLTDIVTLSGTSYNTLAVPDNAAEVLLKGAADFTVGETNVADGYETDEINIGVAGMENIYLKGTDTQEIQVVWVLL